MCRLHPANRQWFVALLAYIAILLHCCHKYYMYVLLLKYNKLNTRCDRRHSNDPDISLCNNCADWLVTAVARRNVIRYLLS